MTKYIGKLPALPLLTAFLLLGAIGPATTTAQNRTAPVPFPVADLFFELNDSAGDLGIHAEIDGGPWTSLEIEDRGGRKLLTIVGKSSLRTQGLTQLAFESAEPSFDELDPAKFFSRFPEGKYDIEADLQNGGTLKSTVDLSHVMAAPPGNITVNGAAAAENCDALPLPEVDFVAGAPVLIRWAEVTQSHPDIGKAGPVEISRYQFFMEYQAGKLSIDLPPDTFEYASPFTEADRGRVFKFEIIARTSTGNNTAVESCFKLN